MGKAKKSKGAGSFSDHVRNRKLHKKSGTAHTVRTNPFEIKINKQKHKVLGKNLTKFDKGLPGVSRSKAIKKRQDTLLVEYKNKRKTNRFVDQRIGENDQSTSLEEKMLQRFAKENKKHHEKAARFNIDDDEEEFDLELTHKGESLRQIEKFERPTDSDVESDGDAGELKGQQVTDNHFGGGILQKSSATDAEQDKTWKDRMEEMIAKSKLQKHERQSEKDELTQMTDQLDDEWRQLHNIVTSNKRKDGDEEQRGADDFDIAVNELKYESRGTPTDRLKTDAELAKIEKDRLDKLEKERLMRMRGEQTKSRPHKSADDLDDGMDYGMDEGEEFEVKYKDGKLISNNPPTEDSEDEDSSADESGDALEEDDEEGEDVGDEGESSEDDDEDDEYSDLESGAEDSDHAKVEINAPKSKRRKKDAGEMKDTHIPYTFNVPKSYTELVELLDKYDFVEQNTVIERMRACNHASLASQNKEHLVRLYSYLLEYFGDVSLRVPVPMALLDSLSLHLYQLASQFPLQTAKHSRHIIIERQKLFSLYCQSKNGRGVWPFLDLLMYLKLFSNIYPASDFRHEVITPAMILASQIYTSCPVTNHRDIAVGLMLTTIMLEYVGFSKALIPECINFLSALLHSALPLNKNKVMVGTAICKTKLLTCKSCGEALREQEVKPFSLTQVIVRGVGNSIYNTDEFVLSALRTTAILLNKFVSLYRSLPSACALFSSSLKAVSNLQITDYPDRLQSSLNDLKSSLESLGSSKLEYVCRERKKPKAIRLYEPNIEENFEAGKKKVTDKVAAEKQKLKNQYKKELKATVREIRKDRAFIADQAIKERVKRDAERQKKTNQILADLQGQQYEVNMHEKMNRKPKRR
ncbi:nucleolar protein 14-like [Watersipora subatra]|uniref:nucleolar protein 14-like n=1 Tax=Watersipora subatra TaxID=2589382 RepID=UPI00355BFB26